MLFYSRGYGRGQGRVSTSKDVSVGMLRYQTMNDPLIYIIILNYKGRRYIQDCLASIYSNGYSNLKVLFVDNASADGSVEYVRDTFPQAEIIANSENLYFCKGNNIGMRQALSAGADYLFVLNNDTALAPGYLKRLSAFMEAHPEAGGCQPLLRFMDEPGLVNSSGCRCSLSGKTWDRDFRKPCTEGLREPLRVLGITGGAMLLRAEAVRGTGMFCEWFSMYSEDVDLSLRLRIQGWELYCVPDAVVFHKFGASVKKHAPLRKIFYCERNSYWVVLRNFPLVKILKSYALCVPFRAATAAYVLLRGKTGYAACILAGLGVGLVSFVCLFPWRLVSAGQRNARRVKTCGFWELMDERQLIPPRPEEQGCSRGRSGVSPSDESTR